MNKELKRMNRSELLELLINQIEENEKLNSQLEECRENLEKKELSLQNVGSMAEAALRLNGVFEAADAAVKQYLDSVKDAAANGNVIYDEMPSFDFSALNKEYEAKYEKPTVSSETVDEAKKEAEKIISDAKKQAAQIISDADKYWESTKIKAKALLNMK